MSHTDVLFRDLHADDLPEVTEIESMCFNCHENGITKLLLTKIPFFREVIIASFKCEECGFHNTSIDSAGKCQDRGVNIVLKVCGKSDLNRRIVMNKLSILSIPSLDSQFPIEEGALTTIEGALTKIVDNINDLQEERRKATPEIAEKLDLFVEKMKNLLNVDESFVLELRDASGNSAIENFMAPKTDPQLSVEYFKRSHEENELLGLNDDEVDKVITKTYVDEAQEEFKPVDEVMFISSNCPNCNVPIECRMKLLNIPHFKEVIVMASSCEECGNKENQIIGGCGISNKGHRITLKIDCPDDLSRDFLKAETAGLRILELDVETQPGSLGGRFTTVEGILKNMADQLCEVSPFLLGDSATRTNSETTLTDIVSKIRAVANGEVFGITFVVSDPAGNSYIQNLYTPEIDPRLTVEEYDRTEEDNEDLGLNDMNTEDYILPGDVNK